MPSLDHGTAQEPNAYCSPIPSSSILMTRWVVGSENYLPIYHLREKLQPPLTREALDSLLYELQRTDRIELSSLHNQDDYSDRQMSAGISQSNGGALFFISVI